MNPESLTKNALGDPMEASEKAAVEAALAASSDTRARHDEIRELGRLLTQAYRQDLAPGPSATTPSRALPSKTSEHSRRRALVALAASVGIAAALGLAAMILSGRHGDVAADPFATPGLADLATFVKRTEVPHAPARGLAWTPVEMPAAAVKTEISRSPWNPERRLVRLVVNRTSSQPAHSLPVRVDGSRVDTQVLGWKEGPDGTLVALLELMPRKPLAQDESLFTLLAPDGARTVADTAADIAAASDDLRFETALAECQRLVESNKAPSRAELARMRSLATPAAAARPADPARQEFVKLVDAALGDRK